MKKLLAILLAMVMVLSLFAGCSDKKSSKKKDKDDDDKKDKETTSATDNTGSTKGTQGTGSNDSTDSTGSAGNKEEVTLTDWERAIDPQRFNNVTVKLETTFTGEEGYKADDNIFAINGNSVSMDGGKTFDESAELVETVQVTMIAPVLDLIANAGAIYMASEGVYIINATECTVNYSAYQAAISATDVVFTLDEDGHLATFSCTMVQDITSETEGDDTLTLDVTFTFSDYGTTGQA